MKKLKFITIICLALAVFTSCKKEEIKVTDGEPLALTVTPGEIVLNQGVSQKDALVFSWTSGTNGKTGNAISYYFEFDRAGNDFKGGYKNNIGSVTDRSLKLKHGALNAKLKELWPDLTDHYGELMEYEARVTATVAQNAAPQQVSPVIKFKVAIYENNFQQMFMIGPATLAKDSWNAKTAQVMQKDEEDPEGGFIYTGMLNAGEMKFLTTRDGFDEAFVKESENDDTKMVYMYKTGEKDGEAIYNVPDYKWNIPVPGEYVVKMNWKKLTCDITLLREAQYLYIAGSAAPSVQQMQLDYKYGVLKYEGVLKPGNYYFTDSSKSTDITYSYGKGASDDQMQKYDGDCGENKGWTVTNTAVYTLLANTIDNTLTITFSPIENVWICGDATPSGWWIDEEHTVKLKKVEDGVFLFSGKLTNGTLKFPLQLGDWFGLFIFAPSNGTVAKGETGMDIGSGHSGDDGDKKWSVTSGGDYNVTVDLNQLKVRFEEK
ncbi:MAG: SusF/SusE family outer membrane protein [Paludibacteraceae bacterium]|nr:SusF/SusE family outer membrane protein [Paludibacteraceae bacterium]